MNLSPMKSAGLDWNRIQSSAEGMSQAEIVQAANETVKMAILEERNEISTDDLARQMDKRKGIRTTVFEKMAHHGSSVP